MDDGAQVLVQKFGGSSLATGGHLQLVAGRVAETYRRNRALAVVVSARGDTTDDLLRLAEAASRTRPARETDQLLATGEIAAAAVLAMALQDRGVPAVSLTGAQAGIRAEGNHGAGVIAGIHTGAVLDLLRQERVAVVAGFQGVDDHGTVVTLGRGGSDTTAVVLAAALGACRCEIYTDVDGVYTADPRLVPGARLLRVITAPVLTEMAFAGAKVMYSRAVELAALSGVEVEVRSSLTQEPGTRVTSGPADPLESCGAVVAITHDESVARVLVQSDRDLATEVFAILAQYGVPVDLVARSGSHEPEFRMGFTIPRPALDRVLQPLRESATRSGGRVEVTDDIAKVSLVGTGLLNRPELIARMLATLDRTGIVTSWVSATQRRTSVTVPRQAIGEAVARLHDELSLERDDFDIDSVATA